jgi:hypothetical protein
MAIKSCYGCDQPDLAKEVARQRASVCSSLRKGFPTETIDVAGSEKRMSRKKAQRLVDSGMARWIKHKTIQFSDGSSNIAGKPGKQPTGSNMLLVDHEGQV